VVCMIIVPFYMCLCSLTAFYRVISVCDFFLKILFRLPYKYIVGNFFFLRKKKAIKKFRFFFWQCTVTITICDEFFYFIFKWVVHCNNL
jgi:hypothetical protein